MKKTSNTTKILLLLLNFLLAISCGPLKFTRISNVKSIPLNNPINAVGGYLGNFSDSTFYMFGGEQNGITKDLIYKFSKEQNSWEVLTERMPSPLSHASIDRGLNNSLYMIGGNYSGVRPNHSLCITNSNTYEIKLNQNQIQVIPLNSIPNEGNHSGIAFHTTTLIDNDIYVFGGKRCNTINGNSMSIDNMNIYKFSIASNVWSLIEGVRLESPIIKGYTINKNNFLYVFDGNINENDGKFKVQVFKYENDSIVFMSSFLIEPPIHSFENCPFIYTRDRDDFNKIYYYPINGSCKIYIDNVLPNNSNMYGFKIENIAEFPDDLERSQTGSVANGGYFSSDWIILTKRGNYFATPRR